MIIEFKKIINKVLLFLRLKRDFLYLDYSNLNIEILKIL